LIEKYRSSWPDRWHDTKKEVVESVLPPRTIPDDVLQFKSTLNLSKGSAIFYSHFNTHPADFKVALLVSEVLN
jgi:hypothetical protein